MSVAALESRSAALPATQAESVILDPVSERPELLPAPAADAQLDQLSQLFALQARSRGAGRRVNLDDVEAARAERQRLQAELRQALKEASRASHKRHKWGKVGKILGTVAKVAAVIGSIAATVVSVGAAGPLAAVVIAGVVLSTAGFAVGEMKAFDRFPNADKWALGLSVAGAALSCGAGVAAGATNAAGAAGGFERGLAITGRVGQGAGGVASAGAGAAAIGEANAARQVRQYQADAEATELEAEHQRWLLEQILEMLETLEQSETETSEALSSAIETKTDTVFNQAAGAQWRG